MDPEVRRAELKQIFHAALECEVAQRAAFLQTACAHDPSLRAEIESLLCYHDQADDFLTSTAIKDAANIFANDANGSEKSARTGDRVSDQTLINLIETVLDGQYQIEALLGQGGMGAVFRARHILLDHHVAIKVMSPKIGSNPAYREMFLREGRAATLFKHANAVIVHDLRESRDGLIYLVLEYLTGRTLKDELKAQQRFSPTAALTMLAPIAGALDAAHARGVIHCDLKPGNIMIGSVADPTAVKLLDLGIARIRQEKADLLHSTDRDLLLGSPQYMSPEQWQQSDDIDGRADLYSLAVIFYELIAGQAPFVETTAESFAYQHVNITSQPLHKLDPSVPKQFSQAIARAMAKNRANRQANCAELIDELQASLQTASEQNRDEMTQSIFPTDWVRVRYVLPAIFITLIGTLFISAIWVVNTKPKAQTSAVVPTIVEVPPTVMVTPAIKKSDPDQDVIWTPASRAFRNLAIDQYWEGQGTARKILSSKNNEQLSCQAEYEFWFMVDKDGAAIGEIDLLYDAELKLEDLPKNSSQTLIVKPIVERNIPRNNHRHFPLVGRLNGSQLRLALVTDNLPQSSTQTPMEFILRAEPTITGGELIMRKVSEKPFSPFIGSAQLKTNTEGDYLAQYQDAQTALTIDWRAQSIRGKQREINRTHEINEALKRLE